MPKSVLIKKNVFITEEHLSSKANINSPELTGVPTAPTAAKGTNTNQIATTAFVHDALDNTEIIDEITEEQIKSLFSQR